MFENLLHQDKIRKQFRDDCHANKLPQSILLSGESYSGKLTTALELARVLNCLNDTAAWKCTCLHCEENRMLTQFSTLLIGYRDCLPEIRICHKNLSDTFEAKFFFMLIRATRKLIRRFDLLIEILDDKKLREIKKRIIILEETLNDISPYTKKEVVVNDKKSLNDKLESLLKTSEELQKNLPALISVAQIRKLIQWSQETSSDGKKIVILEDLGLLDEGARNALLKLIEEPPRGVYLICITHQPSRVMPTLLSRLRNYHFNKRTLEQQQQILSVFFNCNDESSLSLFFCDFQDYSKEMIVNDVELFIEHIFAGSPWLASKEIPAFTNKTHKKFLFMLVKSLFEQLDPNDIKILHYKQDALKHIASAQSNLEEYGQNAGLALDSLFIELMRSFKQYSPHKN